MRLSLVAAGLVILSSVVEGAKQTRALPPLAVLESYLKFEVRKGLENLEEEVLKKGPILFPKIFENVKNTLIAASIQNKSLFRRVLAGYYIGRPTIELIKDIVYVVYLSVYKSEIFTKLSGGVQIDDGVFFNYILDSAEALTDIANRFIKPHSS